MRRGLLAESTKAERLESILDSSVSMVLVIREMIGFEGSSVLGSKCYSGGIFSSRRVCELHSYT